MQIQFVAPRTLWGEVSWENYELGRAAGTESVTLHVAKYLAEFGHDVSIVEEPSGSPDVAIGVNLVLPRDSATKVYLDSHQAWSGIPEHVDGIFVRSYFHQRMQRTVNPNIDPDKFFIVGNGVDPFEWDGEKIKNKDMFIWASSPERGLIHLINLWPAIRWQKPAATLHIYYDVMRSLENWRWGVSRMNVEAQILYSYLNREHMEDFGIYVHGMVQREHYVSAMRQADYLLYTCDPQYPSELFCMTAAEAVAAETKLVIPADIDALNEIYRDCALVIEGPPIDEYPDNSINKAWISAAVDEWDIKPESSQYIIDTYSWYNVARRYESVLLGEEMDFGKPKLRIIPGVINAD